MPIRWKLFGLANYVLLLAYVFLFVGALRFTVEVVPSQENLTPFMPFMISFLIIILNSVFNLYIFHIHLLNKLFTRRMRTFYFISTILYTISLTIILISFILDINDELKFHPADNFVYFMLSIFFLSFLIGLFVLVNQIVVRKFIERNYKKMIENIGRPE